LGPAVRQFCRGGLGPVQVLHQAAGVMRITQLLYWASCVLEYLSTSPIVILSLLLFLGIIVAAAIYDLVTYTIPHFAPLTLIALFVFFAVWQGMPWIAVMSHGSTGIAMLAAGWMLFAVGLLGGGDVKLFAAISLWMGWGELVNYLIMFSLCGGLLALSLLFFRRLPLANFLKRHAWIVTLHDRAQGVPYGIALAAGAFLARPELLSVPV